jgi:hypothetical protein
MKKKGLYWEKILMKINHFDSFTERSLIYLTDDFL